MKRTMIAATVAVASAVAAPASAGVYFAPGQMMESIDNAIKKFSDNMTQTLKNVTERGSELPVAVLPLTAVGVPVTGVVVGLTGSTMVMTGDAISGAGNQVLDIFE